TTFDVQLANIPTCVERYLYLGSREAATDRLLLQEYSIATILSLSVEPIAEADKVAAVAPSTLGASDVNENGCGGGGGGSSSSSSSTIRYLHMPVLNDPNEDLISHFDRLYHLFEAAVTGRRPILVHCTASFSACSTVMAAYLMRRLRLDAARTL